MLKPCRECQTPIASGASRCPRCGKSSPHGLSPIVKYGGGGIVLLVLVAQLAQRGSPPPPRAPEAPADPDRAALAAGVVACRRQVQHRFPGADLPGVLQGLPAVEKVSDRLWRWRETGVLQGVRFGYRCRLNPQAGGVLASDDDEIPYPTE